VAALLPGPSGAILERRRQVTMDSSEHRASIDRVIVDSDPASELAANFSETARILFGAGSYTPVAVLGLRAPTDGRATSSVSVRERLKNSVKQCQTMKSEMLGQPANHLVSGGSGSSSHG